VSVRLLYRGLSKLEIASHKLKITSLEDRVGSLTLSLDAYKILRNLFISTYKRDKLASDTEADRRIIGAGNAWAHGGDAVVDAQLHLILCTVQGDIPYSLYSLFFRPCLHTTGHRPQHRPHEPMRCPHQ
jgi:hypothetical protein